MTEVSGAWSWALAISGQVWLLLFSTGWAWPFLASAVGQVGWITYGFVSHQHGFVALGCFNAVAQVAAWVNVRYDVVRRLAGWWNLRRKRAEVAS